MQYLLVIDEKIMKCTPLQKARISLKIENM